MTQAPPAGPPICNCTNAGTRGAHQWNPTLCPDPNGVPSMALSDITDRVKRALENDPDFSEVENLGDDEIGITGPDDEQYIVTVESA